MLILVAVVLLLVLPEPWALIGFAVALVLAVFEVLFWHRTVRHRRQAVGAETLLGRDAVVLSPCRPAGQVRLDGEIWAASCAAGADPGDTVRVVGRNRLVLVVERKTLASNHPAGVMPPGV
jgi:membrane protein implicated in regulation of membrane protease activity